jgi:hypothetical protein
MVGLRDPILTDKESPKLMPVTLQEFKSKFQGKLKSDEVIRIASWQIYKKKKNKAKLVSQLSTI